MLMAVFVALEFEIGSCGNFGADQCAIRTSGSEGCLRCFSSRTPEMERCFQLRLLITESTNHPMEMEQYCSGHCPIILATAYHYCGMSSAQDHPFNECGAYSVEPTGEGGFDDSSASCFSTCEYCIQRQSKDALRCLQHLLLAQNTNTTSYKNSFCEGDCPLTLTTSLWYCGQVNIGSSGAFAVCRKNGNGRFCSEIFNDMGTDIDVSQCASNRNCQSTQCEAAISKYGCCLGSPIDNMCELEECMVVTGGSPTHLATSLILITMLIISITL